MLELCGALDRRPLLAVAALSGRVSLEMMILLNAWVPTSICAPPPGAAGVLMLPWSVAGCCRASRGRRMARAVAGITGLSISIPIGQTVRRCPGATAISASFLPKAARRARSRRRCVRARASLRAVIT
jgi:hypothetical protein